MQELRRKHALQSQTPLLAAGEAQPSPLVSPLPHNQEPAKKRAQHALESGNNSQFNTSSEPSSPLSQSEVAELKRLLD